MKPPSSPSLLGFALLATAGLSLFFIRQGPDSSTEDAVVSVDQRTSGHHARDQFPAGPVEAVPPSNDHPLILTTDGLADFSNYDLNGDGDPEVDAFLGVYRRIDTSAVKIDLLENVRTFDTLDEPLLNDLLIEQAAKAPDAEVREAARSALFEHGGKKAHESLAAYLESETRAADRQELEKLLSDLQRSPLSLVRSGSKEHRPSQSPPSTNH